MFADAAEMQEIDPVPPTELQIQSRKPKRHCNPESKDETIVDSKYILSKWISPLYKVYFNSLEERFSHMDIFDFVAH